MRPHRGGMRSSTAGIDEPSVGSANIVSISTICPSLPSANETLCLFNDRMEAPVETYRCDHARGGGAMGESLGRVEVDRDRLFEIEMGAPSRTAEAIAESVPLGVATTTASGPEPFE